jgi:hypothetical protein
MFLKRLTKGQDPASEFRAGQQTIRTSRGTAWNDFDEILLSRLNQQPIVFICTSFDSFGIRDQCHSTTCLVGLATVLLSY